MGKPAAKKKIAATITPAVEARIVEMSLLHPEFGAKRLLPLLSSEDINLSASTVYRVLKRNGLQNRDKRLAKIEAQTSVAALPPEGIEKPLPPTVTVSTPAEQPSLVSQSIREKVLPPRGLPIPSITQRAATGQPWFITLVDVVLFFLIVLLGFHTWHNLNQARLEPQFITSTPPVQKTVTMRRESAPAALSDFRMISKRDLFNAPGSEKQAPQKATPVEKLSPAPKEIGLQLVGTVVAYDSRLSRAFIGNRRTRRQEFYGEGDQVNDLRIKKILRNRVIVGTKAGDRLLTVKIEASRQDQATFPAAPPVSHASLPRYQAPGSSSTGSRVREISLDRQEVQNALANIDEVLQGLNLSTYTQFQEPAGFRISNLPQDSVLSKMGLTSRDVIVGINDQKITSPDQAAEFLQTLAESDEVTIRAKRRRRTRRIILSIQ